MKDRIDRFNAQSRRKDNAPDPKEEMTAREKEVESVRDIVQKSGMTEPGINPSGLYDLCGKAS